ncbi:MAG: hypothetical protein ACJ77Z_07360 [Thermoleophilaceae bacterium]
MVVAAPAGAKPTPAQKLFRQKLLDSKSVSHSVKVTLKKGGFVDKEILFADLTGEGKDDAVVTVDSGGASGIVALYVFSAGSGKDLQIVYRNQGLYRALARINPGPALVYSLPQYKDGDELCCPSAYRETTLQWNPKTKRFGVAQRRTVTP